MTLSGNYWNTNGDEVILEGETVEEIAAQLDEDERVNVTVRDEAGFVRGWVHGRNDWRAQ